jgi:hypothetical protein
MAECKTSRLGAERYVRDELLRNLAERGVELDLDVGIKGWFSLPQLTQAIVEQENGVSVLLETEFPPVCQQKLGPVIESAANREGGYWSDAYSDLVRTLLTSKLYLEARDESEIAAKMAAIQKVAAVLEGFFTDEAIDAFVGGIREAIAAVARYTKDSETLFAASVYFERHKALDEDLVDQILETVEEAEVPGTQRVQVPELLELFTGYEDEFAADLAVIQAGNPD